jgi:hypothetical protein
MNKKLVLAASASLLALDCLTIVGLSGGLPKTSGNMRLGADCAKCSGNHYSGRQWNVASSEANYGKGGNGYYEYWHCCSCHNYYFSKDDIPGGYDSSLWKDNGESKASSTDYDDDRVQFGGSGKIHKINSISDGGITIDGERDSIYDNAVKYSFEEGSSTSAAIEAVCKDKVLYIYITVTDSSKATRDFSSDSDSAIASCDSVELWVDALHSEKYASSAWEGKANEDYAKPNEEADYASVGAFKVSAGYQGEDNGAEFVSLLPLSKLCENDGTSAMRSQYIDETHYGAEFAINLGDESTAINSFGEIGLALKVNNASETGANETLCFESINSNVDYLRNYSSFRLEGYEEDGSQFNLSSGKAIVGELAGNQAWSFSGNVITASSRGYALSSSSYSDFSVVLSFDNVASYNPYFGANKAAQKAFLFGGNTNEEGKYEGYALSVSTGWLEILKISPVNGYGEDAYASYEYASTYLFGYTETGIEAKTLRLSVKDGVCTLTEADGTALNGYYAEKEDETFAAGKLGILRDDDVTTNITIGEVANTASASGELDKTSALSFVSDLKASASWGLYENRIVTKSVAYRLSDSSFQDFHAVLSFNGLNPDASTNVNPYFTKIAKKAFLFGGSLDENGVYKGYALHASPNFFEILQLNGYSSTCLGYISADPTGKTVALSLNDGTLTLTNDDTTSLGNFDVSGSSSMSLSSYTGGKVGVLSNDSYESVVTLYECQSL